MGIPAKLAKVQKLLGNRWFAWTALRHGVAATTEHLDAIHFSAPASLVDIGANRGQFSTAVRGLFPKARIEAFEPLPSAGARFEAVFRGDALTRLHRVAIGAKEDRRVFHVADREDSSSLLKIGEGQSLAYGVAAAREIHVDVKPLGQVIDVTVLPRPSLLKIDVQGAELEVLRGIVDLAMFDFIYVELSFVELYEGQSLFEDVERHLAERGFGLRGTFNQSVTEAFGPTQVDCIFTKRS